MNWNRFAFALLGIGCVVAGALLPAAGSVLIPIGAGLAGVAVPSEVAGTLINAFKK
jgi:hypothetical protein